MTNKTARKVNWDGIVAEYSSMDFSYLLFESNLNNVAILFIEIIIHIIKNNSELLNLSRNKFIVKRLDLAYCLYTLRIETPCTRNSDHNPTIILLR